MINIKKAPTKIAGAFISTSMEKPLIF